MQRVLIKTKPLLTGMHATLSGDCSDLYGDLDECELTRIARTETSKAAMTMAEDFIW